MVWGAQDRACTLPNAQYFELVGNRVMSTIQVTTERAKESHITNLESDCSGAEAAWVAYHCLAPELAAGGELGGWALPLATRCGTAAVAAAVVSTPTLTTNTLTAAHSVALFH